ncbi:MAG: anti-sigma factor family protein [Phycisphaerales bacterium]
MNCREVIEFLMQYLDRELPAAQREVFEAHLSKCPCCVKFLDSYRETVALTHECCPQKREPPKPPEGLIEAILAARKAK